MAEVIPVKKALEREPDFASTVLLQVLTKYKDLIPNLPAQERDILQVELLVGGKAFPFQEFMDRLQEHYKDRFEKAVYTKARELINERFMESVIALEDTSRAAIALFLNRFPELKTDEERE